MTEQADKGEKTSLLVFPTQFPIKVMGKSDDRLHDEVVAIFRRHVNDFSPDVISKKYSRNGKWTSLTVVIDAQSREQLDAIYVDLTSHELIEWVL